MTKKGDLGHTTVNSMCLNCGGRRGDHSVVLGCPEIKDGKPVMQRTEKAGIMVNYPIWENKGKVFDWDINDEYEGTRNRLDSVY